MNKANLTWDNIFNTNHQMWGIDTAFALAKECGYKYIAWNGRVYDVNDLNIRSDFGTLEELKLV